MMIADASVIHLSDLATLFAAAQVAGVAAASHDSNKLGSEMLVQPNASCLFPSRWNHMSALVYLCS
jgi:hypothetical protein